MRDDDLAICNKIFLANIEFNWKESYCFFIIFEIKLKLVYILIQ